MFCFENRVVRNIVGDTKPAYDCINACVGEISGKALCTEPCKKCSAD